MATLKDRILPTGTGIRPVRSRKWAPCPIDEHGIAEWIRDAAVNRPVERLTEVQVEDGPGGYLLIWAPRRRRREIAHVLHRPLMNRVVYGGSTTTTGLPGRLAYHRAGLTRAQGIDPDDLLAVTYPCATAGFALMVEQVVLSWLSPMWCQVLRGWGNRNQGVSRVANSSSSRPSKWDCVFPGRPNTKQPTRQERVDAVLRTAAFLLKMRDPGQLWIPEPVESPLVRLRSHVTDGDRLGPEPHQAETAGLPGNRIRACRRGSRSGHHGVGRADADERCGEWALARRNDMPGIQELTGEVTCRCV